MNSTASPDTEEVAPGTVIGSRTLRAVGIPIVVATALLAVFAGLIYGGGVAVLTLGDPGPVVRWGLPIAKLFVNLAAAGMVGVLVTALFTLRAGERAFEVAMNTVSIAAAVFTLAAGATGFLTFLLVFNPAVNVGALFGEQLGQFLLETEVGRTWLITTIWGAVLTLLAFAVRSWTAMFFVAILAVAALVPMGTQGHSGEDAYHHEAMTALILHIIGAAVWLGGLILLITIRPRLDQSRIVDVVARYSSIALAAFVLVTVSGIVRSVIGLSEWASLASPYGAILGVKIIVLVAVGLLGAWYRNRIIGKMRDFATVSRSFWALISLELALSLIHISEPTRH